MKEANMFNLRKVVLLVFAMWTTLNASRAEEAQCGKCMSNMAYCIDETHFYLCPNGEAPLKTTVHECEDDKICTSSEAICVERDEAEADTIGCQDDCNKCPPSSAANNKFTCVSGTQYALCTNGKPSNIIDSCGAGESCNTELYKQHGSICAPACVLDFFGYEATCRNEVATTTPAPIVNTPAPNPEDLKQQCLDKKPDPYNGFFYVQNSKDPECKNFIYCEMFSNEMEFISLTCKSGFFDEDDKICVSKKPESCNKSSDNSGPTKSQPDKPVPEKTESQKPAADKPLPEKPVADKPVSEETESQKPAADKPLPEKPVADKPVSEETESQKPAADKPLPEKPVADKPVSGKTESPKPAADKLLPEKPVADKPVPDKPAADKPLPEKPAVDKPVPEKNN